MDRNRRSQIRQDARRSAALILTNFLECDTDDFSEDPEEQKLYEEYIRQIVAGLQR